jgi:GNAT superfamily N-acetyltransferase
MTIEIIPLTAAKESGRARLLLSEAERIFFETAYTKDFASSEEKAAFRARWFGRYAELYPGAFLLALGEDRSVLGYIAGCIDSFAPASRAILGDIPNYTPEFLAAVVDYPSHLHINVLPGRQGQGIGRALITRFTGLCREHGSPGIHLVTGAVSRAVKFYESCNFKRMEIAGLNPQLAVLTYITAAPQNRPSQT